MDKEELEEEDGVKYKEGGSYKNEIGTGHSRGKAIEMMQRPEMCLQLKKQSPTAFDRVSEFLLSKGQNTKHRACGWRRHSE